MPAERLQQPSCGTAQYESGVQPSRQCLPPSEKPQYQPGPWFSSWHWTSEMQVDAMVLHLPLERSQ